MADDRDQLDGLNEPFKTPAEEFRELWRLVKRAGSAFSKAGDAFGDALVISLMAFQKGTELAVKLWWLTIAALLGSLSPATGGLGVHLLAERPLFTWAPVGVLPAVVLLLRLITWSLGELNAEGGRKVKRDTNERQDPGLDARLGRDAERRDALNARLARLPVELPALEDLPDTANEISTAARLVRAATSGDASLLLARIGGRNLKWGIGRGNLDREVKDRLLEISVEGMGVDEALEVALEPFQYRHATVEFDAGPRRYALIAISGATISSDLIAHVSEAATQLLDEYVWMVHGSDLLEEEP